MKFIHPLFKIVIIFVCFSSILNEKGKKPNKNGKKEIQNKLLNSINKTMHTNGTTHYMKGVAAKVAKVNTVPNKSASQSKKDHVKPKNTKKAPKSSRKHKLTTSRKDEEGADYHGEITKEGGSGEDSEAYENPTTPPKNGQQPANPIQPSSSDQQAPTDQSTGQQQPQKPAPSQTNPKNQQNQQTPPGQQSQQTPPGQQPQQTPSGQQSQHNQQTPTNQQAQQNPMGQQAQQNPMGQQAQQNPMGQQAQQNPMGQQAQQNPMGQQAQQNPMGQQAQQNPMGQQQQQMGGNCSPSSAGCQPMTPPSNMGSCSQLMSQCSPPYTNMPQSSCGISCIPNVNTHFDNCNAMFSSCGGGQSQYQMNPSTSPNMCNNLLAMCQNAATVDSYQNYGPQCASLMGQCAPSAFGSMCSPGMTPMTQPSSSILSGCSSSPKYSFMGDDIWTPPTSTSQQSAMFSDCNDYLSGSYSGTISPMDLSNCQNLMGYCRNGVQNSAGNQLAQQCANILSNCFPTGDSGSCVPGLSTNQCQDYLSNCIPGNNMMAPSGGNAASANVDQCISMMSQCYPSIQANPMQGNAGDSAYKDCSSLLQYCNCINSNCDSPMTPVPNVSANDCAALMGSCYSAAAHLPGVGGMPAGCAPNYMHCKKSCIRGCPKKCCGTARSNIPNHSHH